MAQPVNILLVEDSADDAELIVAALQQTGFCPKWRRVETEAEFLKGLNDCPDIILSDYSMPQFNGLRAVELLQQSALDIPFILISGTVGEEVAVKAMKCGATDYLLKDRIARLGSAVQRALHEVRERIEHKKLKTELESRQQRLNAFFTCAPAGLMLLDTDLRFVQINDTLAEMSGMPAKDHLGKTIREVLPQLASTVEPLLRKVLITGQSLSNVEVSGETEHQPGVTRHWVESFFPIAGSDGRSEGVGAIVVEVTGRKQTEDVLKESERRFREMLENVSLIAMTLDKTGAVTFCNDYLLHLTGWEKSEVVGADWCSKFLPDSSPAKAVFFENIEAGNIPLHYENPIKTKFGGLREIVWNNTMLRDVSGNIVGTASLGEDVTEKKQLEQQFRQAQKMEGIGQLASGVAHDFNNILAVIQLQAGLLRTESNLSAEQLGFAREIEDASHRAANLTRQLLLFSRKQVMQTRDLDLNEVVTNITKMLRRILGEDIQILLKFSPRPLAIHADPGMIDQILLNLAVNARDAMSKGGQLIIETLAGDFEESLTKHMARPRVGSFACLKVTDAGCGIAAEIMPRIFEPFFTTKEVGKGTGLGLATVYGIVEQHQGWVEVQSTVGEGTTFLVYLPRLKTVPDPKAAWSSFTSVKGGKETILLVEDDAHLRDAARIALSRLGYRLREAVNGAEALAVWRKYRDEIRLVLTDLVMPGGMNGKELAETLLKQNPLLKVVYLSGYSIDIAGKELRLTEGVNFLTKPFQAQKLAQIVRSCLDEP